MSSRKHVFDVTSVGLCSSTWPCKLGNVEVKSHFEGKLLVHNLGCDKFNELTYQNVSRLSIEFLGLDLTFNEREDEL